MQLLQGPGRRLSITTTTLTTHRQRKCPPDSQKVSEESCRLMWTMAPADMPVSAPAGGYHSNQSGGEAHASGSNIKLNQNGAPILTSISSRQPLLSAVSSTVLSIPPTDSPIAGGRAECYDDVRSMLQTQPNWGKEKEKVCVSSTSCIMLLRDADMMSSHSNRS